MLMLLWVGASSLMFMAASFMAASRMGHDDAPQPQPAKARPSAAVPPRRAVLRQIHVAAIGLLAAAILKILYLAVYNYYLSKALLPEFDAYSLMLLRLLQAASFLILPCVMIFGALKMKRLASYGWGLAAALLAILPALNTLASFLFRYAHQYFPAGAVLWPVFVVPGLILAAGGFALIVLSRKDVRAAFPTGPGTRGQVGPRLAAVALLLLCAGGGILWAQRPQQQGAFVSQESPDNQYIASVGTWHAMRIFGGDRLTYRFRVQGLGGSVSERWEIPVPSGKLATSYLSQSISDLTFDKHGHIEWLADSSAVKFLVRDIEVARYDVPESAVAGEPPAIGQANQHAKSEAGKTASGQVVAVEDLALRMLAAIRDKEDDVLKSLAVDRIKGWRDALPHFAFEMRERFLQMTGKTFEMRTAETVVDGGRAVVRCTGPESLKGTYLVLFFVKTADGWRNWSLRNSPPSTPLKEHLKQLPPGEPETPPADSSSAFSAVSERVVNDLDKGHGNEALHLQTGTLSSVPADAQMDRKVLDAWLKTNRMDLLADFARNRWALFNIGLTLADFPAARWDEAAPADLTPALASGTTLERLERSGQVFYLLPEQPQWPLSFAFKTREGDQGLLQITGATDNPKGLRIRYKLVARQPGGQRLERE